MASKIRLQAIFDMVKAPCILADIGCDHGLLPIALVKQGKCSKAYACDVRSGPLSRAKDAIKAAGLEGKIIPVLSDGLRDVGSDVNAIVIAGMGYDTIVHILQQDLEKTSQFQQIIVQCNGRVEELRKWISEHGFCIDEERIVKDKHYYQMISMHREQRTPLTKQQCMFGVYLKEDPLFQEYWHHILEKKKKILLQMQEDHENYSITKEWIALIENELDA